MPERGFGGKTRTYRNYLFVQCYAPDRYAFGKSRKQAGGHGGRKNDKTAPVVRPADESTKGLRQSGSDQPVIIGAAAPRQRSEEHTSELLSLMRISYPVFCLKNTTNLHITM